MSEPITPNMSLLQPITGITTGSTANDDFNANWDTLDQHDHSPGKGAQITPAGFNINADLPFNGNNATLLRSARFSLQSAALSGTNDLACLYFSGVDLWANDGSGNQVQITLGGAVNATSSGISSGTATASFVASVLVVNAASNKPANIQAASILLGNNVTSSNYLTLSPPNAMGSSYGLVLPPIPGVNSILGIDTSGNITGAYTVDNSTLDINGSSQLEVKAGGVNTTQLASGAVTQAKRAALGQQVSSGSGAQVTLTTNTITDLTNCSVSLTTTGRPVSIFLEAALTGNTSVCTVGCQASALGNPCSARFYIVRGSTIVSTIYISGYNTCAYAPASIACMDTGASAGTTTYKVQAAADTVGNPGSQAFYTNVRLVAYEL